jgi:restriction endonuclease S subunit
LAAVLRLPGVSQQILNLTSGTSSSHSRIKTDQLKEVLIPLPTADEDIRKIEDISRAIQHSISMKYEGEEILNQKITQLEDILFNN